MPASESFKPLPTGDILWQDTDGNVRTIPPVMTTAQYQYYLARVAAEPNLLLPADPPVIQYSLDRPLEGKVRTTDAAPTEIYRRTLTATTGYAFVARLIGVDAGNGAVRVIHASVAAKRLNAAALLIGTPVVYANHADAAAATWGGVSVNVSGNDVVVLVAGVAGRSIDWNLTGTVVVFAPGGLP